MHRGADIRSRKNLWTITETNAVCCSYKVDLSWKSEFILYSDLRCHSLSNIRPRVGVARNATEIGSRSGNCPPWYQNKSLLRAQGRHLARLGRRRFPGSPRGRQDLCRANAVPRSMRAEQRIEAKAAKSTWIIDGSTRYVAATTGIWRN